MNRNDADWEWEPDAPRGGRRRDDERRLRGPFRWILIGIGVAFGMGLALVLFLTQTDRGREEVLAVTLRALGGQLNGELTAERLEGGLLTGARLYGVALRDTTGAPLILADSVFLRYRLATFAGGDIVLNRVDLYDAALDIFRMPGDTLWNYQGILQSPEPDPGPGVGRATFIERMNLVNTLVTMRTPVEPDDRLSLEAQESEVAEILADTVRYDIREVPGGHLSTARFEVTSAAVAELFIGPDERGGTFLEVLSADADIWMWRDAPLVVRDVRAALHLREGMVTYEAPEVLLASSEGASFGTVDLRGPRPLYDLGITTTSFAISDLRWLFPWLPEDPEAGRGAAKLRVAHQDEELAVIARDVELEMPATRLTGRFGLLVGLEAMRFVDVDLEAEPLRLESVEQLLPADLPVEGLIIGGATVRGDA